MKETTPNTPQMDQDAVNLAKAIRQTESGGNFNARGKSGESGAYQWTPDTWKAHAYEALGNSNAEMTPENQNAVAYTMIKKWKDSGLNAAQISAKWNSGSEHGWENKVGTNKFGVHYDVPKYVKSVTDAYQSIKNGGQPTQDVSSPSSAPQSEPAQPTENRGFFGQDKNDSLYGQVINNSLTRGVQRFFPGKQVGEAIGTLGGYLASDNKEQYDTSAPTPLQVLGDVAQGALSVGAGLPGGTAVKAFGKSIPIKDAVTGLGRIGKAGLVGGALGASNAVSKGSTDLGEIGKEGLIGGLTGSTIGIGGEAINKLSQALPQRVVRSFIPGINEETSQYAISKGLHSPKKMLQESEVSIKDLGSKLGNTLKDAKYAGKGISSKEISDNILKEFPNSGMTSKSVWDEVRKLAKLKSSLIDKLEEGKALTLSEAHELNSTLGSNTFKTVFDDPTTKAGKEVGSKVYHYISDRIKTIAPETSPLFEDLSREYPLRLALEKVIHRGQKSKTFTLRDLVAITSGFTAAGPVGAGAAYLGEKALVNPTINLKSAGLISKLGKQLGYK